MDDVKDEMKLKAQIEFEKFIHEKKREDPKGLIVDAYEGVLYEKRKAEKELLNFKRFKEYEKNRPP